MSMQILPSVVYIRIQDVDEEGGGGWIPGSLVTRVLGASLFGGGGEGERERERAREVERWRDGEGE